MAPASSKPIKTEEVHASPGDCLGEKSSAPVMNRSTSEAQTATTANTTTENPLSSVGHDLIKDEDAGCPSDSLQQMETRKSSRKKSSTSTSASAASPQPLPQLTSDIVELGTASKSRKRGAKADSEDVSRSREDEIRDLKKQITVLKTNLTKTSHKLSDTELQASRLRGELLLEKGKVKSKRDEYQKKIKSGPITMGDDGQMRSLLLKLGDICKDWAEKYAIPDENGKTYNIAERSSILRLLKFRYDAVSSDGEAKVFDGMTNCAELLLNAALTHLVWFEILGRPFYFLDYACTIGGPRGIQTTLEWLVDLGDSSGDAAQKYTYSWLGTLVKTLNPTSTIDADGDREKAARSKKKVMKDAAFKALESVLKQHCGVLLKQLPDGEAKKRDARFLHICRQAHETAQRMWTQGYKVECLTRPSLSEVFSNNSESTKAHLTMLIDHNNISKDGQQTYLVTKPLVYAFGNEKGEFDKAIRPLDPATVCMAEKEDLERATRAWSEEVGKIEHAFAASGIRTTRNTGVATKNTEDLVDPARLNLVTKKQQVGSGFPEAGKPLIIEGGDVYYPTVPIPSVSATYGSDPNRAKQDHNSTDQRNQGSSTSVKNHEYRQDEEIVMLRINMKTGKRKRMARFLELVDNDEDSEESSGGDGAEMTTKPNTHKRRRQRKRSHHGGQDDGENKIGTQKKQMATNQANTAIKHTSMEG